MRIALGRTWKNYEGTLKNGEPLGNIRITPRRT